MHCLKAHSWLDDEKIEACACSCCYECAPSKQASALSLLRMLTVSFMGSVAEKRASVTGAIRMNTGAPRQRRAAVHVPLPSPWGPPLEQQPSALRRHLPPVAHVHRFRSRITIITRQPTNVRAAQSPSH